MGTIILISMINFIFVLLGYTLGTIGDKSKTNEIKHNPLFELFKKDELEDAYIPEED